MSEFAPRNTEHLENFEKLAESSEHLLPTAEQAEPLRRGEKDPVQALVEARTTVQETVSADDEPNPIERLQAAENVPQASQRQVINRELKDITLRRELRNLQRRESAPERALSKLMHQPTVRIVSETAGKTVSRPSGILGGGLVALLGTSSYLYLAKHLGFPYNYGVFLALFAGGFIVGLALELSVHLATASRRTTE